jgi:hypothetical protein
MDSWASGSVSTQPRPPRPKPSSASLELTARKPGGCSHASSACRTGPLSGPARVTGPIASGRSRAAGSMTTRRRRERSASTMFGPLAGRPGTSTTAMSPGVLPTPSHAADATFNVRTIGLRSAKPPRTGTATTRSNGTSGGAQTPGTRPRPGAHRALTKSARAGPVLSQAPHTGGPTLGLSFPSRPAQPPGCRPGQHRPGF